MTPADVLKAIAQGTEVATTLASVFGLDREHIIRVSADAVAKLTPSPPDQSDAYFRARQIAAHQDELDRAKRPIPDPDPTPRPSGR